VTEQYTSFVSVCISIGIFGCDFFTFEFSSVKSFRNQIAIEYLRTFVLPHAKKIKEDLDELK